MTPEEQQLIDEIVRSAQGIRFIQLLAIGEAERLPESISWAEQRQKADRAWKRINEAHESLVTGIKIPRPQ